MPDAVRQDWIASRSGNVLTECGHVTFPDALYRLGGVMKTECHKCGRVVTIVRKATTSEYLGQVLGIEIQDTLPDEPPF